MNRPTHVEARFWVDSMGNTYHRVRVHCGPDTMHDSGITYGYGNAWEDTLRGMVPTLEGERLHDWCRHHHVSYSTCDVSRKKEL